MGLTWISTTETSFEIYHQFAAFRELTDGFNKNAYFHETVFFLRVFANLWFANSRCFCPYVFVVVISSLFDRKLYTQTFTPRCMVFESGLTQPNYTFNKFLHTESVDWDPLLVSLDLEPGWCWLCICLVMFLQKMEIYFLESKHSLKHCLYSLISNQRSIGNVLV